MALIRTEVVRCRASNKQYRFWGSIAIRTVLVPENIRGDTTFYRSRWYCQTTGDVTRIGAHLMVRFFFIPTASIAGSAGAARLRCGGNPLPNAQ